MKKNILKILLILAAAAVLVWIDQLTKGWASAVLKDSDDIIVIPGVFQLHYLENTGMAFGLLENQQLFFYLMTAVILFLILAVLWKTPVNKRFMPMIVLLTLVMAGAVGNFIDRISLRYVIDFLYFSLINFPVFNVADCYVTVSCILLLIFFLFVYRDSELTEYYCFGKGKKHGTDTD